MTLGLTSRTVSHCYRSRSRDDLPPLILKHFQAKWAPARRQGTRHNKDLKRRVIPFGNTLLQLRRSVAIPGEPVQI